MAKVKSNARGVLARFKQKFQTNIVEAELKAGQYLKEWLIEKMEGEHSGEWYYRPARAGGGLYQASAVGEFPAVKSGDLEKSLMVVVPNNVMDGPIRFSLVIDENANGVDYEQHLIAMRRLMIEDAQRMCADELMNIVQTQLRHG